MKTPDEIKTGIERCSSEEMFCAPEDPKCTYDCGDEVCIHNLMRDALAYIQQLEADNAQQARCIENLTDKLNATNDALPRWISVEEKLPEHWHMDDKDRTLINYLVYSPDYGVDVGNYVKPAKRWVCMGLPMNVTHWMPLPQPPKEVAE